MTNAIEYQFFQHGMTVLEKVVGAEKIKDITPESLTSYFGSFANNSDSFDSKFMALGDRLPRDPNLYEKTWKKSIDFSIQKMDVFDYIDDIADDPHLKADYKKSVESIVSLGYDPMLREVTQAIKADVFIAFGTGDGSQFNKLYSAIRPSVLIVVVDSLFDFASSFGNVDWLSIWNNHCIEEDKKIFILCSVDHKLDGIEAYLMQEIPLLMDLSLLVKFNLSTGPTQDLFDAISPDNFEKAIEYGGFIKDEYNMIVNTVKTLAKSPSLYQEPLYQECSGTAIVCGSGPSLTPSLDTIRALQNDGAFVIASASSFGTLLAHGLKPDLLCLLERGAFNASMEDQYRAVALKYDATDVKVLMSSTCPDGIVDVFQNTMVYMRPALTPASIFSHSVFNILPFEGPLTTNTSAAVALKLKPQQVFLFGVDLGAKDLSNIRAKGAVGSTPRDFKDQVEANFGGVCYTDRYMLDARFVFERIASSFKELGVTPFNCSDGALISGWSSLPPQNAQAFHIHNENLLRSKCFSWWDSCSPYSQEMLMSRWNSADPRTSIFRTLQSLTDLLESTIKPDTKSFWYRFHEILSITEQRRSLQFAPRIIRGHFIKVSSVFLRQRAVFVSAGANGETLSSFDSQFLEIMKSRVKYLTIQLYSLVDHAETFIFS